MNQGFNKVSLFNDGHHHPPSLPLVLPSCYSFNSETQKLVHEVKPSSPEFKLVPEAVELLESISKPVAVVSINGPYRSGKSYFLSRMLGSTETFKLGHTTDACTRGIWMATSVLECEDFVLVLLDTEGIDATDKANEAGATKLLVLTMLLSSMFIYNSRNVPKGRDLKKMSCLAGISRMVEDYNHDRSHLHLPDFLWLLRDVDSIPLSSDGCELTPTDFIQQILHRSASHKVCAVLRHYFPSLHCLTISPPSTDESVLSKITSNVEKLSPQFNSNIESAFDYILRNVKVKLGYDTQIKCDGKMLACLLEQNFKHFSKDSSSIPTLRVSWMTAVELRLKNVADRLADEYESEMSTQLDGKLPMLEGENGERGETLMNIHLQVFAKKRLELQKLILTFQAQSLSDKLTSLEDTLIDYFDKDIAVICSYLSQDKVIGGRLFKFVQANIKASEDLCISLYNSCYQSTVLPKLQTLLSTQMPGDINEELHKFKCEYFKEASGPALHSIYKCMRESSVKLEADLQLIPGPVEELEVVGVDDDRVKIRWKAPTVNLPSVEQYEILIKSKGKDWNVVSTRKGHSALIQGLKSITWYCIAVRAMSAKYTGNKVMVVRVRTLMSKSVQNTIHAGAVVASPIVYPCLVAYAATGSITSGIMTKSPWDVIGGGLMLSILPAAFIIGSTPIAGSLASSDQYRKEISDRLGDLSESDTEVIQWKTDGDGLVDVPDDSDSDMNDQVACSGKYKDLDESSDES